MKIKKKLIIILTVVFSSFNCQHSKKDLILTYLDFENFCGSKSLNLLFFEIKNNTSDTLYLSRNNIAIRVFKDNKQLNNNENKSIGQILCSEKYKNQSKIESEITNEKLTAILKHSFAKKLYSKNFKNLKSKISEDFIIQVIKNATIVILPNKSINYSTIFNNEEIDNSCKVYAEYKNVSTFTFFHNGSGKSEKVIKVHN